MSDTSLAQRPAKVAGAGDDDSQRIRGRGWPLERALFVLAGTMTGLSALLSALVSPWFLLLTGFVARQPVALRRRQRLPGLAHPPVRVRPQAGIGVQMSSPGPIGRLGRYAATHRRRVFVTWAIVAVGLGFLAPRVETALSGAGWQANGSDSVQVRERIEREFSGADSYALQVAVHSRDLTVSDPAFQRTVARVERTLAADPAVRAVVPPAPRTSISSDGHVAIVVGTAAEGPNGMVAAADHLKGRLAGLASPGVAANLTGAAGMWSDFNEANRDAMLRSELFSWPVTLAILVLAFGSLVAAGLPLMLTIVGLIASAGLLYLGTPISADLDLGDELRADVRARARNRLRAVHRDALSQLPLRPGRASGRGRRGDDGHGRQGGAVLRAHGPRLAGGGDAGTEPGLSLCVSRDHGLGPLRPRRDADAAPGGAGEAGQPGRPAGASLGARGRPPLAPLRPLGRAALAPPGPLRRPRPGRAARCWHRRSSAFGPACRRSRSSRRATAPASRLRAISAAFGPGAPGTMQIVVPRGEARAAPPPWARTGASPR